MGRELPLGRIAGIRIGMDWSVPLIALLYTWILATDRFPYEQPGLSDTAYWLAGIAGALLFFASLLAHEIGHAVVARREGIGVHHISLWLLGGLTHLESNAETPKAEIRIAAIGPLTSAAVGLLCIGIDWQVADTGTAGLLGHVFAWVGFLNLLLAAFNMIPASPLDGGKVLAGIIWSRTGSATGATVTAARVGMVAGAAMVTYGIFNLDGGGYGFWLLIVGVFIFTAARREALSAPVIASLEGVTVGQGMLALPPQAPADLPVDQFLRTMSRDQPHQAYPVVDHTGTVVAMLTADAIRAVPPPAWPTLRVRDLAFPLDRVAVVGTTDTLLSAAQKIEGTPSDDAFVVGPDGRVVGTIGTETIEWAMRAHQPTGA